MRSVLKLKALERSANHLDAISRGYSKELREQGNLNQEQMDLLGKVEKYDTKVKDGELHAVPGQGVRGNAPDPARADASETRQVERGSRTSGQRAGA